MSKLTRFSVSIDSELLAQFDKQMQSDGSPTRSKAVADLMRGSLIREQWKDGKDVAASIVIVYDHHKRDLSNTLTHIQHDYHELIASSVHIHLDHHNCLEVIVVKGKPARVDELTQKLKATKGVKHCSLVAASTGEGL